MANDLKEGLTLQAIMKKHGKEYQKYRAAKQIEGEVAMGPVEWYGERSQTAKKNKPTAPKPISSILKPGSKGILRG